MLLQPVSAVWLVAALAAPERPQPRAYQAPKARRHFVSVWLARECVEPYAFHTQPLWDLLGQPVHEVHLESFQYRTQDNRTVVNVLEYGKRASEIGATVYPFGSSTGPTLAVHGSIETIPSIRVSFTGPAPSATYELTNGRATDVGVRLDMSARSPGWGLRAHAFLSCRGGRLETDTPNGHGHAAE